MSEHIELQKDDDQAIDAARLMYEDDLPENITDAEYAAWFDKSFILDGVRVGPEFSRQRYAPIPFPPRIEAARCALPDLRFVIYAGAVAVGALVATVFLLREVWRERVLS